jgi:alcohol dehydrogenase class IV
LASPAAPPLCARWINWIFGIHAGRIIVISELIGDLGRSVGLASIMRVAGVVTRLIPIPQPTLLVGPGASGRLGQAVAGFSHRKVLLVTDHLIARLGLYQDLTHALTRGGTPFMVFDEVTQDAPIPLIDKGVALFQSEHCDAIIAIGGGSVMDAAKAIALCAANGRSPRQLVGYFRGRYPPLPLYAVPTTAGTGSEVSVVAVISDPVEHKKLVLTDSRLVPRMAALDPGLMTGLPPDITAATGMDALTHAIEAFLGHWSTHYTDRMALAAVAMIFENLRTACQHGQDLVAREKMALASTYAGFAFTRASVGYVHAIAHQLGARYHTPHGLANALALPHVLRFYGTSVQHKLALLAVQAKVGQQGEAHEVLASKFIASIEALSRDLGLPNQLPALRKADIPALAKAACREADINYPVPRYMSEGDCETLIAALLLRIVSRSRKSRTPK